MEVHGLNSGSVARVGSGDGVTVVSLVRDSPNRDSPEVSSSSLGAGLALDCCARVGFVFPCILFKACCVRLFLLLSNSFAILAPSCRRSAWMASFCSAVLDAKSFACHFKSFTIYASLFSTSNLASSGWSSRGNPRKTFCCGI